MNVTIAASGQPDSKVLHQLVTADRVCLAVAALIAATVLSGWLVPAVASALPSGWSLMKANTALAVLLYTVSFVLIKPKQRILLLLAGRACASVAAFLAGAVLVEYWSGRTSGLSTLLAADSGAQMPGRMSIQTASCFILLWLSAMIEQSRQDLLGHALDALVAALVVFAMVLIAGYIFGATGLVGESSTTRASPQTVVCLALLVFVQTSRRAPYGYFSVLVGASIGSQFARIALPISQALVFLVVFAAADLLAKGYLSLPYATAVTASSMAALLFLLVILLARKINGLEGALREMSFSDELTGLHNRRSFYLLGEQAMREARRDATPLTVLFFDADGLKKINDTLGHDAGSELLRDIAILLRTSFRDSDLVGRLGGDEFAIVAHRHETQLEAALLRLKDSTEAANAVGDKPYRIGFSIGAATIEATSDESFAELVERADAAMYQEKRQRHAASETGVLPNELLQPTPIGGAAELGR